MHPGNSNHASRESPDSVMVRDVVIGRAVGELEPGDALDLGCGIGLNTLMLARQGWRATGIDISPGAIRLATETARNENIDARFIQADILTWEPDRHYDLVIATYSLPGGAEAHTFMRTAIKALKPGGTLLAVEWDHSMAERWGLDPDDLHSPADLAATVPGLTIESAESRTIADMLRDDAQQGGVDATIAYLRARKPEQPDDEG